MVRGLRESERLLEFGQRAVDLQGIGDCGRALIADLAINETAATGKRAHCQALVKGRSGDVQGITRKRALT